MKIGKMKQSVVEMTSNYSLKSMKKMLKLEKTSIHYVQFVQLQEFVLPLVLAKKVMEFGVESIWKRVKFPENLTNTRQKKTGLTPGNI